MSSRIYVFCNIDGIAIAFSARADLAECFEGHQIVWGEPSDWWGQIVQRSLFLHALSCSFHCNCRLTLSFPVSAATGRRRLPYSSCRACCSGAPGTACPPWCPPCRSQCPAPVLTACPFVPGPRQRPCQDSDCPSGQRCCFNGCRVLCQSVCQRPCPPGQKCSLGCRRPPCPGFARCVPIRPTCKGFACPRGSHCVMSGGRPKCEPLSTRPGTCPVNDLLPRIFCLKDAEDECSTDNDCTRNQKCCSYGCVRTCVQTCRPACRSDENCVLRRPVGPCQGSGCLPPITTCQRKEPCGSVVNCHPGSRCVLRDGKSRVRDTTWQTRRLPHQRLAASHHMHGRRYG